MKDSTRRMLRTWYQGLVTAVLVVPVLMQLLPAKDEQIAKVSAAILAAVGLVAKVINLLEEKGLIPAWLKPDAALPGIEPGTGDEPKDPEDMSETEQEAAEELGTVPVEEVEEPKPVFKAPAKKVASKAVRQRNGRR